MALRQQYHGIFTRDCRKKMKNATLSLAKEMIISKSKNWSNQYQLNLLLEFTKKCCRHEDSNGKKSVATDDQLIHAQHALSEPVKCFQDAPELGLRHYTAPASYEGLATSQSREDEYSLKEGHIAYTLAMHQSITQAVAKQTPAPSVYEEAITMPRDKGVMVNISQKIAPSLPENHAYVTGICIQPWPPKLSGPHEFVVNSTPNGQPYTKTAWTTTRISCTYMMSFLDI